jgi:hypothetical protein
MAKRWESREPPPSPERIKEQLGWRLIEAERAAVQLLEARSALQPFRSMLSRRHGASAQKQKP